MATPPTPTDAPPSPPGATRTPPDCQAGPAGGGSDYIPIGGSIRLVSIQGLAHELGVPVPTAVEMLQTLQVPLFRPAPGVCYFNLCTFEFLLYALLRPGGHGFHGPSDTEALSAAFADAPAHFPAMQQIASYYGLLYRAAVRDRVRQLASQFRQAMSVPRRRPRRKADLDSSHLRGTI